MTDRQILEKAIQKAIDGGWDPRGYYGWGIEPDLTVETVMSHYDCDWREDPECVREFVFNHDFAKALWGEDYANFIEGQSGDTLPFMAIKNWKGHLANMVVAADPIKYLGQNI